MLVWQVVPFVGHVLVLIFALAAAVVLMFMRTLVEFNGAGPTLLAIGVLAVYAVWKAASAVAVYAKNQLKGRRSAPEPITLRQFLEIFRTLDDKLYSGLLHREGVRVWLTEISPDNPYWCGPNCLQPDGKLRPWTEPHSHCLKCGQILVASNQSNEAIMKGLLIEMQRAADDRRELYKAVASELERGAEVMEELDRLLKRPDAEQRTEEIVKLLERWPKVQ
jgi:hypothetical protein